MFEKVLVATDLSTASEMVCRNLHGLTSLGVKCVLLVHALGIRHLQAMEPMLAADVKPRLIQLKELIEKQGFEVEIHILSDIPEWEINRAAKNLGASLIVLGSHGATLGREVLMGSVTFNILNRAEIPVLVMPVRMFEKENKQRIEVICSGACKHVLFATDFSENAARAFLYVEQMVKSCARRVTLIHVQDKSRIGGHLMDRLDEFNTIDLDRLEQLKGRLVSLGATEVSIAIPFGSPVQEILKEIGTQDDTMVVMGSQGRGFITEVFLGSVSHQVARHSAAPVLLVPALR